MKHKRLGDDRGLALPLALMAFVVLGALSAAILSIGGSEAQIASNHLRAIQAQFLAEAGLELAFNTLRTTPNLVTSATATLQNIIPTTQLGGAGSYTVQYQKAGANTVRVVSTGASAVGGSQKILRAIMSASFVSNHGILTGGNMKIPGSPTVQGQCGSVHTNGNFDVPGGPSISGAATASGTYNVSNNASVGPGSGGGTPTEMVPVVNPTDFLNIAKSSLPANQVFQMKANGQVLDGNGTLLHTGSFNGWSYTSGTPATWQFSSSAGQVDGTYYFEGNATVSGSPGSASTPWVTTLIATGNLQIPGSPQIQASITDTLFIAGGAVTVSGSPSLGFNGLIAAHEQFSLSGHPTINGFIIAENASATSNTISGTPHITYDCNRNPPLPGPLQILSWGL